MQIIKEVPRCSRTFTLYCWHCRVVILAVVAAAAFSEGCAEKPYVVLAPDSSVPAGQLSEGHSDQTPNDLRPFGALTLPFPPPAPDTGLQSPLDESSALAALSPSPSLALPDSTLRSLLDGLSAQPELPPSPLLVLPDPTLRSLLDGLSAQPELPPSPLLALPDSALRSLLDGLSAQPELPPLQSLAPLVAAPQSLLDGLSALGEFSVPPSPNVPPAQLLLDRSLIAPDPVALVPHPYPETLKAIVDRSNDRASVRSNDDLFVDAIESMKRSIAPVACRRTITDGKPSIDSILGTAFFVSEQGAFVTAAHVVKQFPVGCVPAIYLPVSSWQTDQTTFSIRFYDFSRCVIDEALDVAACKTNEDISQLRPVGTPVVPVRFALDIPADGTPIAFSGFPLQERRPLSARGGVAAYRSLRGIPRAVLVIDKGAWPGVSGGPVFTADGGVIGMIVQTGVNIGTGLAYALGLCR